MSDTTHTSVIARIFFSCSQGETRKWDVNGIGISVQQDWAFTYIRCQDFKSSYKFKISSQTKASKLKNAEKLFATEATKMVNQALLPDFFLK